MIPLDNPPWGSKLTDDETYMGSIWQRWFSKLLNSYNNMTATGTTAQRPNPAPFIGFMYYDTTINKPIWAKTATTWVLADGTAA